MGWGLRTSHWRTQRGEHTGKCIGSRTCPLAHRTPAAGATSHRWARTPAAEGTPRGQGPALCPQQRAIGPPRTAAATTFRIRCRRPQALAHRGIRTASGPGSAKREKQERGKQSKGDWVCPVNGSRCAVQHGRMGLTCVGRLTSWRPGVAPSMTAASGWSAAAAVPASAAVGWSNTGTATVTPVSTMESGWVPTPPPDHHHHGRSNASS